MGQAEAQPVVAAEPSVVSGIEEAGENEVLENEEQQAEEEVGAGAHGEERQEGEEEAAEAAEEKLEEKKGPLKFKRKVNGKIIEATEDDLWKHYGLEVSAREKLEEAAAQKKEIQADKDQLAKFFSAMQSKPEMAFELLNSMGHDAKKIAREMVLNDLEYERMSDAERRAHDNEKKLKEFEEKEEIRKKAEEEHQESLVRQEFEESVDVTISEALKLSGLEPKPKTIARLAEACQTLVNASKNGELPPAQKIVDKFLSFQRQDVGEILGEQDPERLVELGILNDNSIARIVKWHLAKNKANLPSFSGTSSKASGTKNSKSKPKIGVNDFFNKL